MAVTGTSETNILSCLLAKKMGVKKTIAEVENMEYINLAENTGIDTIINKKISAASRIFRHTTNPNVTQVKYMTGTDAEVLEFNVPENAKITKGTLRSIDFPKDAIVGGGTRDGDTIYCNRRYNYKCETTKLLYLHYPQHTINFLNFLPDSL